MGYGPPKRMPPAPGHPIRRGGLPWIYATWLAKLLGGDQCTWSAWFKARFRYVKFEEQALDLAEWNRDHNALMRDRKQELEECGYRVMTEAQNEFTLSGQSAIVVGKPDIIAVEEAVEDPRVLIVDGKTGRERDSDVWQVFLYLYAYPLCRLDVKGKYAGEVHYKRGDKRVPVPIASLTPDRRNDIIKMVKVIAGPEPTRSPSREECKRCNIGAADCPERFKESALVGAGIAAEF